MAHTLTEITDANVRDILHKIVFHDFVDRLPKSASLNEIKAAAFDALYPTLMDAREELDLDAIEALVGDQSGHADVVGYLLGAYGCATENAADEDDAIDKPEAGDGAEAPEAKKPEASPADLALLESDIELFGSVGPGLFVGFIGSAHPKNAGLYVIRGMAHQLGTPKGRFIPVQIEFDRATAGHVRDSLTKTRFD